MVGPRYATFIARPRIGSIAFWSFVVVVLLGWSVVQYMIPGGQHVLDQFQLPELVLVLALSFGMPLGLVRSNILSSRITTDLQRMGVQTLRPLRITSARSFNKWCVREGVTVDQVAEAGAMNFPKPPSFLYTISR